jgi:hypothetical protein
MPAHALPVAALLSLLIAQDFTRDAIALGRTRDDALYEAFNKGYELAAGGAIERAEIITEFRRAVLVVRERADQGQYAVTERDLTLAMAPHRGKIAFTIHARLHPLHTYAKVPNYDLYISTGPRTPPISTKDLERIPMYAIGPPGGPLVGVRLEATFERDDIAAAKAPTLILTDDRADVIWQARLDLSRFR